MSKAQQMIEHIVVTFVEAALAYVIVIPNPHLNKTAIAGAVGAGLSAVYNLIRQSNPTIQPTPPFTPVTTTTVVPAVPAVVTPDPAQPLVQG